MPINTATDYITVEELAAIQEATYSPKLMNKGEVQELDRIGYPTFDYAMSQAPSEEVQSVQGGYRFEVANNRSQRHQWIHGSKRLKFEQHFTPFHMDFYLGKGHFGDQLSIDYVERAGIKVRDTKEGIRDGMVGKPMQEAVFNVLARNKKDIENAVKLDLARRFWTANADEGDCFFGIDSLFPVTNNTTGTIGGQSRAMQQLRHNLITGVTIDTIEEAFAKMEVYTSDGNGGNGSMTDWICMGDEVFFMLARLYKGTSTLRGKFEIQVGYDKAAKLAEKFRIGLGTDAFVGPNGIICVREPLFRKLDQWETAAVPWAKRCYWLNFSHLYLLLEKHNEMVNAGRPYDQLVSYSSVFNSLCLGTRAPMAQGAITLA